MIHGAHCTKTTSKIGLTSKKKNLGMIKKKIKFSSYIYKEIKNGAVAKSYI
jgi:hypothetical protein